MNILIAKLLKPFFKIRQSKIALNQTLTLKLGVTLVLNVTRVYDFVNPAAPLLMAMTKAKINSGVLRPKIPSEAVSQHQIQQFFLGEHAPNPP